MLGITKDFSPRFLRRYSDVGGAVDKAVRDYIDDVREVPSPHKKRATDSGFASPTFKDARQRVELGHHE